MKNANLARLHRTVTSLRAERATCVRRLAEIDDVFSEVGIAPPVPVVEGPTGRGSGPAWVMTYMKGHPMALSGEINSAWIADGRSGKADQVLAILVRKGTLKRRKQREKRGSIYRLT